MTPTYDLRLLAGRHRREHIQAAHPQPVGYDGPETNYFFIGDPQRPSGGFFERLAFLGNVPILDAHSVNRHRPTPATSGSDLCHRLRADVRRRRRLPAVACQSRSRSLNAIAGFQYIHGTYLAPDSDEPATDTPYGYTPKEIQDYIIAAQANDGCSASHELLPARQRQRHDLHHAAGAVPAALPAVRRPRRCDRHVGADRAGDDFCRHSPRRSSKPATTERITPIRSRERFFRRRPSTRSRPRWISSTTFPRASTWR